MHITFFKYDVAGYPIEKFQKLVIKWENRISKTRIFLLKNVIKTLSLVPNVRGFTMNLNSFLEILKFHINKIAMHFEPRFQSQK
jgi:hypothetical protein